MGLIFKENPKLSELKHRLSNLQNEREAAAVTYNTLRDTELSEGTIKWQYRSEDDLTPLALNEIGMNGWELVSALSYVTGLGLGHTKVSEVHMRYVFKRKLRNDSDYSQELHDARDNVSALDEEITRIKTDISTYPRGLI